MSFFETNSLKDVHASIQEVYLSDQRPWVVGYSGGKDSTCALQLVWNALALLPAEQRQTGLNQMIGLALDIAVELEKERK